MANMNDCPHICPTVKSPDKKKVFLEAGSDRSKLNSYARPYEPGEIEPFEKKVYPPNAPPLYLPQPTDSTSGDILVMGPIGPWAPGHMDWTPQAGMTGTRPVVDKYSITHYSTGGWRKNNEKTLTPVATNKAKELDQNIKKALDAEFQALNAKQNASNNKLDERIKILTKWEKKVRATVDAITNETETLELTRTKLKGACRILMMPEAISRECLELRTHRYEPDLVRDDAEQELIKEVAIVGEIRKIFQETLMKVEIQLENNKAAKAVIEGDWSDKLVALKLDVQNRSMGDNSTISLFHPGVVRWPENATTLEYWDHYCAESVRNCEEVRQKSHDLRQRLMQIIANGSQDMKIQGQRTDIALAATVDATQKMCEKLEETLRDNLKTTADIENLIDYLKESLRNLNQRKKLSMTRLHRRNYDRPNVENCRDEAQYALMAEAKFIAESVDSFNDKLREAEAVRAELMKYRGALEKDIACKRKSLNIDEDRITRVRAHMPTPEEFANA